MAMIRSSFAPLVTVDDEVDLNHVVYLIDPQDPDNTAKWSALWDWKSSGQIGPVIGVPTTPPITVPTTPTGHTGIIRVADHTRPIGMSYWPVLNNSAGRSDLRVLISLDDNLTLFTIEKASGAISRVTPLPLAPNNGEYVYWSFSNPDLFYLPQGNALLSYDVRGAGVKVVFVAPSPIQQCHSSYDGRVHSFTMDGVAAVYRDGQITRYHSPDAYDECQIDKSGDWLLIKEGQAGKVADNRIVHLPSGAQWTITDAEKACGHSDMGFGYMVGEDDQSEPGGVFRLWRFTLDGPRDVGSLYHWGGWQSMTRYVSHCNAKPGSPEGQRLLFSSVESGLVMVTMGTNEMRVVAPSLTNVEALGGGDDYWKKTRACIDPTGEYAAWSGNDNTDRLRVFVVKV